MIAFLLVLLPQKGKAMLYLKNKDSGEIHVLDDDARSKEECNVDQIEDPLALEESEALRDVAQHPEHICGHCWPKEEHDLSSS